MDPGFAPFGREHRFVVAEGNQRDREIGLESLDRLRIGRVRISSKACAKDLTSLALRR